MKDEMIGTGKTELSESVESPEEIDITSLVLGSPALARLVEEVRNEEIAELYAYNRMHNRHNRSR